MKDTWNHAETIRCPCCGKVQQAVVAHTKPDWTYRHECVLCGYLIKKNDWKEEEEE